MRKASAQSTQPTECDSGLQVVLSPNGARGDSPEPALSEVEGATPWVCADDRASPVRAKQQLLSRPFRAFFKGCLFLFGRWPRKARIQEGISRRASSASHGTANCTRQPCGGWTRMVDFFAIMSFCPYICVLIG